MVKHYEDTGEKRYDSDLSVRIGQSFLYSADAAIFWAATNAPIMIKEVLDTKAFENYAKTADLKFVDIEEKVTAVISTKL